VRQARPLALAGALALISLLAGCGRDAEPAKRPSGPQPVLVTTAVVQPTTLQIYEDVVGSLENVLDPKIAAEVAGRVTRVLGYTGKKVAKGELVAEIDPADFEIQTRAESAEVSRLQNLLAQQERVLERQQRLVSQGFISQNAVDDATAQRNALRDQLVGARARAEGGRRNLGKTRVVAPIDGAIEVQVVAVGDYVKVGDPLFHLVGMQRLRARLPLPESAALRLRPGLAVRLSAPPAPEQAIEARISELKPTVGTASRSLEAIVNFEADGGVFRGGGSVNARIIVATRDGALMVPEESVVLRPAGPVVYLVRDGRAEQRVVEIGIRQDGLQEITKGLSPGDVVAVDGAGFLSHGAAVVLPKPKAAAGRPAGAEKRGPS
jgi:membrane fusion protein (multidrug efflux system)